MMQPDTIGDEHEIIFDDDDEDDTEIIPTHRLNEALRRNIRSPQSNHSEGIQHFQPLAGDIDEAVQAAIRLESFLSSPPSSSSSSSNARNADENILFTDDTKDNPRNIMFIQSNDKSTIQQITKEPTDMSLVKTNTFDTMMMHSQLSNIATKGTGDATENNSTITSSFDPYSIQHHNNVRQPMHALNHSPAIDMQPVAKSLFDNDNIHEDDDDTDVEIATVTSSTVKSISNNAPSLQNIEGVTPILKIPGTVGFLEMEEEPPRTPIHTNIHNVSSNPMPQQYSIYDPIQTSSGLLLTHRRIPPSSSLSSPQPTTTIRTQFEMECTGTTSKAQRGQPSSTSNSYPFSLQHQYPMRKDGSGISLTPILRYVRLWMVFSTIVLFFGTMVLLHHVVNTKEINSIENQTNYGVVTKDKTNDNSIEYDEQSGIFHLHGDEDIQLIPLTENDIADEETEEIILIPFPPNEDPKRRNHRRRLEQHNNPRRMVGVPALIHDNEKVNHHENSPLLERTLRQLHTLRNEFDAWMIRHDKLYDTEEERRYRFQIWSHNHERTIEKNERHGPCSMTGQEVFGSNHLQDLTSDEFKSQFLNGYYLSREPIRRESPEQEQKVLGVHIDVPPQYHPTVHGRLLQQQRNHDSMGIDYQGGCKWYDVSCILRYLFSTFLYGLGGTMEPAYDANSYPTCT